MKHGLPLALAALAAVLFSSCAYDDYYTGYGASYYDYAYPAVYGTVFLGYDYHHHHYRYKYKRCSHCNHYPCRGGHRTNYRYYERHHNKPLHHAHTRAKHDRDYQRRYTQHQRSGNGNRDPYAGGNRGPSSTRPGTSRPSSGSRPGSRNGNTNPVATRSGPRGQDLFSSNSRTRPGFGDQPRSRGSRPSSGASTRSGSSTRSGGGSAGRNQASPGRSRPATPAPSRSGPAPSRGRSSPPPPQQSTNSKRKLVSTPPSYSSSRSAVSSRSMRSASSRMGSGGGRSGKPGKR